MHTLNRAGWLHKGQEWQYGRRLPLGKSAGIEYTCEQLNLLQPGGGKYLITDLAEFSIYRPKEGVHEGQKTTI